MEFDDVIGLVFALVAIGSLVHSISYYKQQYELALDRESNLADRNLELVGAVAKILHHFDENDVCAHHNIAQKSRAISDARIALTGLPKAEPTQLT